MNYTANDAAPLLGLKPGSVRAFIKRGVILATKHGRDWLITDAEIARYLSERKNIGKVVLTL